MKGLELRQVTLEDADYLLKLRNEPTTQQASINSREVGIQEHESWLNSKLSDSSCQFFIGVHDSRKIGFIRADERNSSLEISLAVSPEHRGLGYCEKLLMSLIEINPSTAFTAKIKEANKASMACFKKVGFEVKFTEAGIASLSLISD